MRDRNDRTNDQKVALAWARRIPDISWNVDTPPHPNDAAPGVLAAEFARIQPECGQVAGEHETVAADVKEWF
jgi:hypothetical protein